MNIECIFYDKLILSGLIIFFGISILLLLYIRRLWKEINYLENSIENINYERGEEK